jgi:hypothetical protein
LLSALSQVLWRAHDKLQPGQSLGDHALLPDLGQVSAHLAVVHPTKDNRRIVGQWSAAVMVSTMSRDPRRNESAIWTAIARRRLRATHLRHQPALRSHRQCTTSASTQANPRASDHEDHPGQKMAH